VNQWLSENKARREIQRVAALDGRGRAILRIWWKEEGAHA
jgi:hypothetical protein